MMNFQPDRQGPNGFFGLPSNWSHALTPFENGVGGRFEGEVADLVVFGTIPPQLNGTFYRIMVDPFYPLQEGNPPVEGDGNICAFRIKDGRVDMKVRYVDTERLKLERQANKRLFGLYRNPFSHHPCVRAAVDSTANTNLVYWAGKLLALKESAQPYAVDPDTLETLCYDPFKSPGKTFSAHPKVDPFTNELVVFGYEAKGLGTDDIVTYSIDKQGQIHDEQWIKSPWPAFIHDCTITPNFLILVLWPYDADVKRMEAGGQHWVYNKDRPTTFVVVPRRPSQRPAGWSPGETRVYTWDHALQLHTAGSWEEGDKLFFESSRVYYNIFPVLGDPKDKPFRDMEADYVRWEIDLSQPTNTRLADPKVILDVPGEMARIDERFLTRPYDKLFCPVVMPGKSCPVPPILPFGLNGYAMLDKAKGETAMFDPGLGCTIEEPIFVPRSEDAPEGDGWVLGMIQRIDLNRSDLVVLDTRDFAKPVAVVQLPFRTKGQIHGNWVDSVPEKSLVRTLESCEVSGRGALVPET
ncbi:putative carotenoid cleavage dioxygenase [Chaetomidium leptoderma]|uniref:Carotenoid cleavage dioxygenase n=1 Tax=Chaetomidium leptoderma TaxID=669021 RepID=A0AAN6VD28_9PEZI|nr:putative carotenoid cleavage dioxygenase [Chaetomidium leptoderma]